MLKTLTFLAAVLTVGLLGGFLWLAANASPVFGGPALAGIALGRASGDVRVVGRHLTCADAGPATQTATCSLDVAGQPLRVAVTFGDEYRETFAECTAEYAGRQAACEPAQYVVQSPSLARVDAAALGLSDADLAAVEARYPGSGLPEGGWTWLGVGVALVGALSLGASIGAWVGRPAFSARFWITAGLTALALFFAITIGLMTVISGLALLD